MKKLRHVEHMLKDLMVEVSFTKEKALFSSENDHYLHRSFIIHDVVGGDHFLKREFAYKLMPAYDDLGNCKSVQIKEGVIQDLVVAPISELCGVPLSTRLEMILHVWRAAQNRYGISYDKVIYKPDQMYIDGALYDKYGENHYPQLGS